MKKLPFVPTGRLAPGHVHKSCERLHNFINRATSEVVFQLSALDLVRVGGDSQIGTPELT